MDGLGFLRQVIGSMLFVVLLFGCGGPTATPYPSPSEVDWDTAVELLTTGEVEMVTQLHSLEVTLTMKDGTEIHTMEPNIDAVFQAVKECGQPCGEIILATE
jgi:hypothetical protein